MHELQAEEILEFGEHAAGPASQRYSRMARRDQFRLAFVRRGSWPSSRASRAAILLWQ